MIASHIWNPLLYGFGCTVLSAGLLACGGGGGDPVTAPAAPVGAASPTVLSGTVIYDAPVQRASVVVHDARGQSWTTTSDDAGVYRIEIPAGTTLTPPLMVRATGTGRQWKVGVGATLAGSALAGTLNDAMVPVTIDPARAVDIPVQLYAVSNGAGVTHVTPASTLVTNRLTFQRADTWFANLGKSGTTIAAALTPAPLAAAQTAVKQALVQAGLPAALVDDPTASALMPVNLTTTYQKLVSGDVLSAAGSLLAAVADNAINFGCGGESYGIMSDDNLPRPSCLPGANIDQSWLLTTFIGADLLRSRDIEVRATELAGATGPGGGWKYQSPQRGAVARRAIVGAKIAAVLQEVAGSSPLDGTSGNALNRLRTWDAATWDATNDKLCGSLTAADLSDLTYSYQELKLSMKPGAGGPTDDAAEPLALSGVMKSTAVNRIMPLSFSDGSMVQACPIIKGNAVLLRQLVSGYQLGATRPPLASLLASMEAGLNAWLARTPAEHADLTSAATLLIIGPAVDLDVNYFGGKLALNPNNPISRITAYTVFCTDAVVQLSICDDKYTPDQFRTDLTALAAAVPASYAAGSSGGEQSAATVLLADLGNRAADVLMTEYEQHFDKYFDAHTLYTIADASGYAYFQWALDNPERDASIAVPDVSAVGLQVDGSQLLLSGQFAIQRIDVHLPAFKTTQLSSGGLRLAPVRVSGDWYPYAALCDSADQACMGRLRRTRQYTQPTLSTSLSGSATAANFGGSFWQTYLRSMNLHDEVMQYGPGHLELSLTLKGQ